MLKRDLFGYLSIISVLITLTLLFTGLIGTITIDIELMIGKGKVPTIEGYPLGWIVFIITPLIGAIFGIIQLSKKNKKLGVIGLIFNILLIWLMYEVYWSFMIIPIGSRGLDVIDLNTLSDTCKNAVKSHNFTMVRACSATPFSLEGRELTVVRVKFGGEEGNYCLDVCTYDMYVGVIDNGKKYSLCYDDWNENREKDHDIPELHPDLFLLMERLVDSGNAVDCIHNQLTKKFYDNESTCMQIPAGRYREGCLQEVGWKKESDFKEATRDATDLETCSDAPSSSARERCITHVAHNLEDPAICDKITDAQERNEDCLYVMDIYLKPRTKELNLAVCKKMDPNYIKRHSSWMGLPVVYSCIISMAIDFEDKSICEELPTTSLKKRCAGEFENFEKYK